MIISSEENHAFIPKVAVYMELISHEEGKPAIALLILFSQLFIYDFINIRGSIQRQKCLLYVATLNTKEKHNNLTNV
eukprot:snap_masked-scaffold_12-processed-gene-2.20-mRNA-1 protein AED:1.00 eAED:1.00 QI:0/0/0/0/1/1/2/0/76